MVQLLLFWFRKSFPVRSLVKNRSSAVEMLRYMHKGGRTASERFPPISAEIRGHLKCRKKMHRKTETLRGGKCREKKVRVCTSCGSWWLSALTDGWIHAMPACTSHVVCMFVNVIGESSFSSFRVAAATLMSEWRTAASEWLLEPSYQSGFWKPHVRVAAGTLISEWLLEPSSQSGCWNPHIRVAVGTLISEWLLKPSYQSGFGTLMSEWLLEPSSQSGCWNPHIRVTVGTLISEWLLEHSYQSGWWNPHVRMVVGTLISVWLLEPSYQSGCWKLHIRVAAGTLVPEWLTTASELLLRASCRSGSPQVQTSCWEPRVS